MRRLDPCLAPAGYSPRRYETLSPAPVLGMGERMTDLLDIQALFANGEQGGYWPADPAYAYEDSAGTIPASVNGVVGLRFDVSRGLQNIENITNSNNEAALFSLGISNVLYNISRSQQSSIPGSGYYAEYVSTSNSNVFHQHSQLFDAIANKTYKFSLKFYVPTGGISTFRIYDSNDGSWFGISSSVKDQWVNVSVIRPPKATNWAYTIGNNSTDTISNGQIAFLLDDVSVIEIVGNHAIQATTANKPYLRRTPTTGKYWYDSNTATGEMNVTFASALGSACTIATVTPEGVSILENQTVGTTYNICPPYNYSSDVLIINRALTAAEKALVTRVMQRSMPTLGSELITNGEFDTNTSSWTFEGTATNNSTPGTLIGTTGPAANLLAYQAINVSSGMRYLLKGVVLGGSSVSFYTGVSSYANNYGQTPFGLSTMIYGISSPTASTMYVNIFGAGANNTLLVDSVSVRGIL